MSLHVAYGGGCRDHSFKLLADPIPLVTSIYTYKLYLVHDGNGDPCRANVMDTLHFDFTNFSDAHLLDTTADAFSPNDYRIRVYKRINGENEFYGDYILERP